MLAPFGLRQRPVAPMDLARVDRDEAGHGFKQSGLAGAVGPDQAERFPGIHRKGYVGKRTLIAISLVQSRHPHQNHRGLRNGNARYGGCKVHSIICIRRTSPAGRSSNKGIPVW